METVPKSIQPTSSLQSPWKVILYILGTLLLFFFALDLMISSFQHLGRDHVQQIIEATTNPFTGLFIGLLITAMLQSSSTTTALVVAMVASGSISLESAIPIIMGANVGTTITSTIVSLGFISRKKEFRRAVAAGTYHCFFNLLTVVILFPLEYYYGFLSTISSETGRFLFGDSQPLHTGSRTLPGFNPMINFLLEIIPGLLLIVISFVLLFGSILLFRRVISDLLKARSPEAFSRFFFKSPFKSFSWGVITTAAIRSSSITTSVVVPVVAKKITNLRLAAPFIMGANVGTTITAFIAAAMNNNGGGAISIAIAHFLFNVIGVLLFFPIEVLREIPVKLASGLGKLTLKYPLACFLFILLTFFIIPFSLIYFNQGGQKTYELTYKVTNREGETYYRIASRINTKRGAGDWRIFHGRDKMDDEQPHDILPVQVKANTLFAGEQMFLFNKPGFCWDAEDEIGKYEGCVEQFLSSFRSSAITTDSVFVFRIRYEKQTQPDTRIYIDARHAIVISREELNSADSVIHSEKLIRFEHY